MTSDLGAVLVFLRAKGEQGMPACTQALVLEGEPCDTPVSLQLQGSEVLDALSQGKAQ